MTDYNDGKWHGWNGGECPVHPETIVDVRFLQEFYAPEAEHCAARRFFWDSLKNPVVGFRVIKEYKAPREFTLYMDEAGNVASWTGGNMMPPEGACDVIHVREVAE